MRWSIAFLFLAGAAISVTGDVFSPLNFAHDANLFRYQDDLYDDYDLEEVEELDCISPFLDFEGRCLYYNSDDSEWLNWNSAQKACEAINGNLIEIDPEEQLPLSEYLVNKTGESNIYGAFWTGGNDMKNESEWLWLNGDPVEGDFGDGESNNITGLNENCLMLAANDAIYRDQDCENKWGYLCEPGPCYNVTCGINAHCDVVDYATFDCVCDVGYEGDADTECTPINPCDERPCGDHAVCIQDSWQSYHCKCEDGYVGEPPANPCVYDPCYNIACGAHATCKQFNSTAAECLCNNGYEGNPLQSCNLIDLCEGVDCAEHASCHITGDNGECRCDEGYPHGDPLVEGCSGDSAVVASMFLLALCCAILFGQQTI